MENGNLDFSFFNQLLIFKQSLSLRHSGISQVWLKLASRFKNYYGWLGKKPDRGEGRQRDDHTCRRTWKLHSACQQPTRGMSYNQGDSIWFNWIKQINDRFAVSVQTNKSHSYGYSHWVFFSDFFWFAFFFWLWKWAWRIPNLPVKHSVAWNILIMCPWGKKKSMKERIYMTMPFLFTLVCT